MTTTANCPHCKERDALKPLKKGITDTAGQKVTVWKCAACGYTEGR